MKTIGIVRGLRARFELRRAEAKRIAERCAAAVIRAVQRRKRRNTA